MRGDLNIFFRTAVLAIVISVIIFFYFTVAAKYLICKIKYCFINLITEININEI